MEDNNAKLLRIREIMDENSLTQTKLAKQIGVSQGNISDMLRGERAIGKNIANKFLISFGINPEWLITGKGDKYKKNLLGVEADEMPIAQGEEFYTETPNGSKFYKSGDKLLMKVPLVPYCAYGRFANEADTLEPDIEDWRSEEFIVPEVVHGKYLAFGIKGESMDNGMRDSFENGDIVLARELDRVHWANGIKFNKRPYWVVVFDSSVLIKQIVDQDMAEGTFTFHSLNPSPEYGDFKLNIEDIRRLYYVVQKKPKEVNY